MTITPEQAAHETRDAILNVGGRFMRIPTTYTRGGELGFEGLDFYVAGRAGVLGEVPGSVVTAAFVFFSPDVVEPSWERSAAVMPRRDAAHEWAECAHADAREWPDGAIDWAELATLLGRVVAFAPVAGAPLFAGWRELPEPDRRARARAAPAQRVARAARRAARRGGAHGRARADRGHRRTHADDDPDVRLDGGS